MIGRTVAPAVALVAVALMIAGPVVASPPRTDALPTSAADRFWTDDTSFYRSPWYAGRHRIMIPFGCTRAPYYPHDSRCPGRQGFHHGIDIAMRCGVKVFSNVPGRVVRPGAPGVLGAAYGSKAFRIRHDGQDLVFGHVRRVLVSPGDRVRPGDVIARAGKLAAPDGCHLHFEVRPAGGGYTSAVRPRSLLELRRVGQPAR